MWTVAARAIAGALGAALLTTIASASASSGNGKIVFESGVGATPADYQLYEANQDGTGLTTLARGLDASWSPDGMRIAYVGPGEQGGRDVYVMNADGSGQTRLTTGLAPSLYL